MTAIVLDASVAVKLVSEEPGSDVALDRIAAAGMIIAPDWMMIEASHALWKKSRLSSFDEPLARAALDALTRIVEKVVPAGVLLPAALQLSFALPHPIYDCLYLALAQREGAVVLTADGKFSDAAARAGFADHVRYLHD